MNTLIKPSALLIIVLFISGNAFSQKVMSQASANILPAIELSINDDNTSTTTVSGLSDIAASTTTIVRHSVPSDTLSLVLYKDPLTFPTYNTPSPTIIFEITTEYQ